MSDLMRSEGGDLIITCTPFSEFKSICNKGLTTAKKERGAMIYDGSSVKSLYPHNLCNIVFANTRIIEFNKAQSSHTASLFPGLKTGITANDAILI